MKSTSRNFLLGLGLAAGAALTFTALAGRTGKRVKDYLSDKLSDLRSKKTDDDSDSYYI